MRLEGKTAIITGAGSGIEKAIAFAMAREGTDIVVSERNDKTENEVVIEERH